MNLDVLLSASGAIVVLCAAASRVPAALADLLRACIPTLQAARELKQAWRSDSASGTSHPLHPFQRPLPHPTRRHRDADPSQGDTGSELADRRQRSGGPT
ncbi:hypothetical protein [Streptomyces sp. NBC_01334]|uniref:hypothetical protein n=1 Tax=Streptomyces sp. NBC_01334 TaxID=2903827 RepID=UPI002E0D172C|nr:hypothetical protein OG736_05810 [Streptomyces sp. NBC_01334]